MAGVTGCNIIAVYVEPTPYIVALIGRMRRHWEGSIKTYYITTDLSQPWAMRLDAEYDGVLPRGNFSKLWSLWLALRRDRKNTILHLCGWGHPVLLGAMLMAAALSVPVAVESDTPDRRPVASWRVLIKRLFYPWLFRLPRRFLPGGTAQARYLTRFGVNKDRVTVAQMTVDVCAIRRFCAADRNVMKLKMRARWGVAADTPVVLYVGRLEVEKGVQTLLSALHRAVNDSPDLRLVVVGEGSMRPRVEAMAEHVDRRVIYLGRLTGDELLQTYLAADLLALPSLSEAWGLVVNEAMACGLPVIVSDRVGCVEDLVRDGETGLVVAAADEAALAGAMTQLARSEEARRRMGRAAEKLISTWTLGNEARNVISVWEAIAR